MINYFENKKILITGGLGFLGSTLAIQLTELGAKVIVVDNLAPLYGGNIYNLKNFENRIQIIINDMRNMEIMKELIVGVDLIFHLAAQVSYIDSLKMPYEDLDLNARATLNILECCRLHNPKAKIVFSSSRMVYGKVEVPILTEACSTNPLSLYGIHKLTSEKYLTMYNKDFGIPITILRLTNPYGPRQQMKHSKYSLVGWFIRQAIEGNEIKIFGDGNQLRDYIYVDDIIQAMIKCAESDLSTGEIINLGSGQASRFCDMVSEVINVVKKGRFVMVPWPPNYEKIETGDVSLDISKLQNITGWSPKVSLKEGIEKTYNYYKKYSAHYY